MNVITKDVSNYFISGNIKDDIAAFDTYAKAHVLNYTGSAYSSTAPGIVNFSFAGAPLDQNVTALAAALSAHLTVSLELLRKNRIKAVDANTARLIYLPASFDGHTFSMSDVAQRNWIAIKASLDIYEELGAWPVPVTCEPDEEYLLTSQVHAKQFATAMLMSVAIKYNSGRALKLLLKAATTKAEIDAIVDNR